ncbi:MAG: dephospho-CoA kinase [Ruminococcaceae bacterium]|nr:dephospho-CoA kinase [Oscillospiraceae bacterium]
MIIIGLSGQSGAGKTTALEIFKIKGFEVLDCDKVSRHVMKKDTPCTKELIFVFGEEILFEDGEINRKKLGEIVFFDKEKLAILTEITHRYIKEEIYKEIEKAKRENKKVFVLDAPLLFESGLDKICDITLGIVASKEKRIDRIVERDGITREIAEKRIESQLDEEKLKKLTHVTIENNLSIEEFEKAIYTFIESKGLEK